MRRSRARLEYRKKIILIEYLISTRFATLNVQQLLSTASEVPRIARARVYTRLKSDHGRNACDRIETPNPITPKMSAVLLQRHPYVLSMLSLPLCDRPAKVPPPMSTQYKLKQS